jgi:hypothetical protein
MSSQAITLPAHARRLDHRRGTGRYGLEAGEVGGPGIAHEARGRYRRTVGPLESESKGTKRRVRSDGGSKMPLEVEPRSARPRHGRSRTWGAGIENMHLTQISSAFFNRVRRT